MRIFKLKPDEEERFFKHLPRFLFYYSFLFVIFWAALAKRSAAEIRERILSGDVTTDFLYSTLMVLLLLTITDAYLAWKGTTWNTPRAALFMLFGFFIMLLVVMYVGRASILFVFVVALILIYINTLIKIREESRKK